MAHIRVAGISGSLRSRSINSAMLRASQALTPEGMSIEIVSIADLPVYNMDLESDFPASVKEFKEKVKACDAVLFATPEHNFSYSGVIKNAIDWGSRPYDDMCWTSKPVAIQSASPSWTGGLRAQYHLHQVVAYLEMNLVRFPEVIVGGAKAKFDADLNLIDDMAKGQIQKQLLALRALVESLR